MRYKVALSKQAHKDLKKIKEAGLLSKTKSILEQLSENPFSPSPPYEKLSGDLAGHYSRRINLQHRAVYSVNNGRMEIKVLRLWTHYE